MAKKAKKKAAKSAVKGKKTAKRKVIAAKVKRKGTGAKKAAKKSAKKAKKSSLAHVTDTRNSGLDMSGFEQGQPGPTPADRPAPIALAPAPLTIEQAEAFLRQNAPEKLATGDRGPIAGAEGGAHTGRFPASGAEPSPANTASPAASNADDDRGRIAGAVDPSLGTAAASTTTRDPTFGERPGAQAARSSVPPVTPQPIRGEAPRRTPGR